MQSLAVIPAGNNAIPGPASAGFASKAHIIPGRRRMQCPRAAVDPRNPQAVTPVRCRPATVGCSAGRRLQWPGPLFRSPPIPAIFTRFAMTAKFFGWSTTFGSRWRRPLKTRSRNLDLFRSRTNPAAETPLAGREPLSLRMLARRIRTDGFVKRCVLTLAAKPPSGPGQPRNAESARRALVTPTGVDCWPRFG
jgi:hypothetical protein